MASILRTLSPSSLEILSCSSDHLGRDDDTCRCRLMLAVNVDPGQEPDSFHGLEAAIDTENASIAHCDGGWMVAHPPGCLDLDGNHLRSAWFRDEDHATSYLSWFAAYGLPVRSGGDLAGNATDEQDPRMVFEGWGVWEADGSVCGPIQIQRYDTLESGREPLPSDECAWELVVHQAQAGS